MSINIQEGSGQIHIGTPFGKYLYELAKNNKYKTYLEVGTWKGNGSTYCVLEGLRERLEVVPENIHFYSFESNIEFFTEALTHHITKGYPYLHLIFGRLHEYGIMYREEIETHPKYNDVKIHYEKWYTQDCIDYKNSPYINPSLLPDIDVIILDGGEFSSYSDWLALKDKNIKVICLDDTAVMKNERVYKELKENNNWIILDEGEDRHGWAIFLHKSELTS